MSSTGITFYAAKTEFTRNFETMGQLMDYMKRKKITTVKGWSFEPDEYDDDVIQLVDAQCRSYRIEIYEPFSYETVANQLNTLL